MILEPSQSVGPSQSYTQNCKKNKQVHSDIPNGSWGEEDLKMNSTIKRKAIPAQKYQGLSMSCSHSLGARSPGPQLETILEDTDPLTRLLSVEEPFVVSFR